MDKTKRITELREQIKEMREGGSEPEDIAILVQELNKELSNKCHEGGKSG